MAVFKVHKTSDYTVVSTNHLREKEMSLKAKGLLTIMLSLPENWDYSVIGLAALSKDGKDSVMGAIDELTEFGYLEVETKRNDKGQYDSIYNVYEKPNRENRCGKSESDNPTQYNIDIKDNNIPPSNSTLFDISHKDSITIPQGSVEKSVKRFVKPTIEQIKAYCEERNNGIDAEDFYYFYESKGWKIGSSPMKDWKAAVKTWEIKKKQKDAPQQKTHVFI